MLDIAPETETILEREASREGVSVDTLIRRILVPRSAFAMPSTVTPSGEEMRARFLALLALPKEEVARLNAPSIAHLEAQLAEADNATPEEIAQAESEWEAHKHSMNENRRATGERLLYIDVQT